MSGITNMLDLLINNLNKQQQQIEILGVPFDSLNKVVSCFKTEAKGKNLLIKPIAQDSHLLYQVHQKEYIFGLIPLDYNSSTDLYAFLDVNQFYEKLAQAILE